MGFLRRFFGTRAGGDGGDGGVAAAAREPADPPADAATIDADERARDLELARFDQDRVDDLVRRQQRYADLKWTPPAQGGERRADDGDAAAG